MAKENTKSGKVDLNESSVYGKDANDNFAADEGDTATEETLDRLEEITGGADEPGIYEGKLARAVDRLDALTDEEIDALRVDLFQDKPLANSRDGSGRIVDDVGAETMAGITESGADVGDRGVEIATPGRDDASGAIRRHHPSTNRSENVVEGNLDEPRDDERGERKADEGTAA